MNGYEHPTVGAMRDKMAQRERQGYTAVRAKFNKQVGRLAHADSLAPAAYAKIREALGKLHDEKERILMQALKDLGSRCPLVLLDRMRVEFHPGLEKYFLDDKLILEFRIAAGVSGPTHALPETYKYQLNYRKFY